ncbi:MAG: NfeD family protein [Bryobacterales bacterium]|nr:NfeD family protein [Bryobacteraceae bacterium]MDW8355275.1 NfeD family protein [Bryobacterales bacterium]
MAQPASEPRGKGVFRRYLLLQIPGWILVALILAGLHRWAGLPLWAAATAYAVYVGKDFLLYPFLRRAYEPDPRSGVERLVGQRGVAETDLSPDGFVRVRGELWGAELEPAGARALRGDPIVVTGARGMTLRVRRSE